MTPTVTEVFEAAKVLPREERAELAEQLLATLDRHEVSDQAWYTALHEAVDAGIVSLDTGRSIRIPEGALRGYLGERGRLASERVAARTER
jgi:hypothetical protein